MFKDLQAEVKYNITYKKELQAQKGKSESKNPSLVPIVPYRFDSKMLDSINFVDNKKNGTTKGREADINVLNQIKTEALLCIDELNELENERAQII